MNLEKVQKDCVGFSYYLVLQLASETVLHVYMCNRSGHSECTLTSLNCPYAARQSVRVRQSHQTFNSTIPIISIATAFSVLPKFPVEGEGH